MRNNEIVMIRNIKLNINTNTTKCLDRYSRNICSQNVRKVIPYVRNNTSENRIFKVIVK